jgi:hypothetical protein
MLIWLFELNLNFLFNTLKPVYSNLHCFQFFNHVFLIIFTVFFLVEK